MRLNRKKKAKALWVSLIVILIVVGGCAKNEKEHSGKGSQRESATAGADVKEPTKLRFFYGDSGVPFPDGVNPSNNPFINIVKKIANVDLNVEVPGYQDFETKFNLMLASGELPDLVHSWLLPAATKAADDGAFIDLKQYYDHSPIVQKVISKEMMELAKSPSGHYYRIPMAFNKAPQGSGIVVREDLIQKYNDGAMPDTVDSWVDLLYKIKKANPNSIPMSNRVVGDKILNYGGLPFYRMLGAMPFDDRIQDGKVISNFVTPEYRAATEIMKKLYDDGILDKEWATNDADKWNRLWFGNSDTLFSEDTADQLIPQAAAPFNGTIPGLPPTNRYLYASPLKALPEVVKDKRYTESFQSLPITTHGLYISSTSKNPDAAWRTIEALASDEFYNALWYGFEGDQYKVVNGEKVFDFDKLADPSINYRLHLNFVFGFTAGQEVSAAKNKEVMGEANADKAYASLKPSSEEAERNGINPLLLSNDKISDQAIAKLTEINEYISTTTAELIMGRITMDKLDQKVADFQKKYASVYEEKTKAYTDMKPRLSALGVKALDF